MDRASTFPILPSVPLSFEEQLPPEPEEIAPFPVQVLFDAIKHLLYPPEVANSGLIASEELPMMSISGTLGTSPIEMISV